MKTSSVKTKSFLRRDEYAQLGKLSIDGEILDVGGSKHSGYHELIGGTHTFIVGNIDDSYGLDVVFDAEEAWPFPDGKFAAVLVINLLEHLYRYQNAIRETYRVLRSDGRIVGVVPFVFNVHGCPHDYFRYTDTTIERMLREQGFTDITIVPLGTGAGAVVYHALIGFARFYWMADVGIALARAFDGLIARIKPDNRMSQKYMPLGYYFEAKKP